MNLLNKLKQSFKTLAITFALLLCLFSTTTMTANAVENKCADSEFKFSGQLKNGGFTAVARKNIPSTSSMTFNHGIISGLNKGTGNIALIYIARDGLVEYICAGLNNVGNNTDIIDTCGVGPNAIGPAIIDPGNTLVYITGSGFPLENDGEIMISLCE